MDKISNFKQSFTDIVFKEIELPNVLHSIGMLLPWTMITFHLLSQDILHDWFARLTDIDNYCTIGLVYYFSVIQKSV